jgi:hypothetical protein
LLTRAQTQVSHPSHPHPQQHVQPTPHHQPQPVPIPPRIHLATPYAPVTHPPPGSTVVRPGDPRIGGRLCHKCLGRGTVPFLIFEEVSCPVCGGVGRVF